MKEYRKFFHFGRSDDWKKRKYISIEFALQKWIGIGIEFGGGDGDEFNIWIGFFLQTYFGISTPWIRKLVERIDGKTQLMWNVGDHTLGYEIHIQDRWNYRGWKRGYVDYLTKIFGNSKYSEELLLEGKNEIAMPEKMYPCTWNTFRSSWKRPRSPFTKKVERISIEIPKGIPIPGKGENSWDCGDDATFGVTMPYNGSLRDALNEVASDALKTRMRRANLNWKPREEV